MSERITPRTYVVVFTMLLGLTALTVMAAYLDLGPLNTLVALGIAATKGLLVLLYFMHLRESSHLLWMFAGSGFLFLGLLIVLTLTDVVTRIWL